MLFWLHLLIIAYLMVVIIIEIFAERSWKRQAAYALILIPFVLRVLQIK